MICLTLWFSEFVSLSGWFSGMWLFVVALPLLCPAIWPILVIFGFSCWLYDTLCTSASLYVCALIFGLAVPVIDTVLRIALLVACLWVIMSSVLFPLACCLWFVPVICCLRLGCFVLCPVCVLTLCFAGSILLLCADLGCCLAGDCPYNWVLVGL
jgi:hypothetical protein